MNHLQARSTSTGLREVLARPVCPPFDPARIPEDPTRCNDGLADSGSRRRRACAVRRAKSEARKRTRARVRRASPQGGRPGSAPVPPLACAPSPPHRSRAASGRLRAQPKAAARLQCTRRNCSGSSRVHRNTCLPHCPTPRPCRPCPRPSPLQLRGAGQRPTIRSSRRRRSSSRLSSRLSSSRRLPSNSGLSSRSSRSRPRSSSRSRSSSRLPSSSGRSSRSRRRRHSRWPSRRDLRRRPSRDARPARAGIRLTPAAGRSTA